MLRIADTPGRDRPRERLRSHGARTLTDSELLALVLRTGSRERGVLDVASDLLAASGGLRSLSEANPRDLARTDGVGEAKAGSVIAAFELGRRAAEGAPDVRPKLRTAADIAACARSAIIDVAREEVLLLIVNRANCLIEVRRITVGSQEKCLLDPKDVITEVLRKGGSGFGVAHTHPSGDPMPSAEDGAVTRALITAAEAIGLRFLDHVIVTRDAWRVVQTAPYAWEGS